jgi:excisionase family DNA binding protein
MGDYMTINQVADVLNVCRRSVYRWVHDGTLPAYRMGPKLVRIKREAVEQFMEAQPVAQ